jgi:hypothetical protein
VIVTILTYSLLLLFTSVLIQLDYFTLFSYYVIVYSDAFGCVFSAVQ